MAKAPPPTPKDPEADNPLSDAMKRLAESARSAEQLSKSFDVVSLAASHFGRALTSIGGAFGAALSPLVGAVGAFAGQLSALAKARAADPGAALGLGEGLALAGGAAVAAAGAIASLAQVAKQTAGLVSPTSLMLFNRAVADTTATVGVAMLPVLRMFAASIREAGEVALPAMRRLVPIMERLADAAGEQFSAQLEMAANLFESMLPAVEALIPIQRLLATSLQLMIAPLNLATVLLTPVIELTAKALEALLIPVQLLADLANDASRALTLFSQSLVSALAGMFDEQAKQGKDAVGGLKDAAGELRSGFQKLLQTMLVLSAVAAKALSPAFGDKFIDAMLKKTAGPAREDTRGLRPAENARFVKDAESFGKDLLAAASIAFGGGKGRTQEDFLKGIEGELKDVRNNMDGVAERVIKGLGDKITEELPPKLAEALKKILPGWRDIVPPSLQPGGTGDNKPGMVRQGVNAALRGLGGPVGGALADINQ